MTMLPVWLFSFVVDQYHDLVTVALITVIGYDYREYRFCSDTMVLIDVSQS